MMRPLISSFLAAAGIVAAFAMSAAPAQAEKRVALVVGNNDYRNVPKLQKAVNESVAFQRGLHVKEELDAENAIKAEGCELVELDGAQHDAFAKAVQPIYAEARKQLGNELFDLVGMK